MTTSYKPPPIMQLETVLGITLDADGAGGYQGPLYGGMLRLRARVRRQVGLQLLFTQRVLLRGRATYQPVGPGYIQELHEDTSLFISRAVQACIEVYHELFTACDTMLARLALIQDSNDVSPEVLF